MRRLIGETVAEAAFYATLFGLLAWYAFGSGSQNAMASLFILGFIAPVVLLLSLGGRLIEWVGKGTPPYEPTLLLPPPAQDPLSAALGFSQTVDLDSEETCLLIEFDPDIDVAEREALGAIIGSLGGVVEVHSFAPGRR